VKAIVTRSWEVRSTQHDENGSEFTPRNGIIYAAIDRIFLNLLQEMRTVFLIVAVTGPRQVGKSTLVRQDSFVSGNHDTGSGPKNRLGVGMEITHYLYNSFVIATDGLRVAIDPGGELYHFSFRPIIPRDVWSSITHVLVTHADPDHHWHTDRLVAESDATVICGTGLTQVRDDKRFILGPRNRGLAFTYSPLNLVTVDAGEAVDVSGIRVTGLAAEHGPLSFRFGPIRKTLHPGPTERIGYGATGFSLEIEGRLIVNLGDTLKLLDDWTGVSRPDVLMIPIGGDEVGNTMGIRDAIEVTEALRPRLVIPCHHDIPSFFRKNANPTDVLSFVEAIEANGIECRNLSRSETVVV
jgi:L-ascorbate metabolism protein UlaG (beta-lactamase superfamily)